MTGREVCLFLADRRGAERNWEITQVNELLTQMEAFDGIFVCTTNASACEVDRKKVDTRITC